MRKIIIVLALIGTSVGLGSPAQAAPPNDYGNGCLANNTATNSTVLMTAKSAANPLPITAPITGVVTKATFTLPALGFTIPTTLDSLRPAGGAQYTVVAASGIINVGGGTQSYDVRMPVTAGDLLGLTSSLGALECSTANAGDVVGTATGVVAPGQTATFTTATSEALPVVATIEPDADHDGFGDSTQDGCPQSASYQVPCPTVLLDSFGSATSRAITLVVTSNVETVVSVTGSVSVAKAGHRGAAKIKLKGGTKAVHPGSLGKFTVKYPAALRSALAKISSRQFLKATVLASSKDVRGRITVKKVTVKIPGTKH